MSISSKKPYFGIDRRPISIFTPMPSGCAETGMQSLGWSDRYESSDGLSNFIEEFIINGSNSGMKRFVCMYPAGAAPEVGSSNIYQPLSMPSLELSYNGHLCTRSNPFLAWGNPFSIWRDKISEWKSIFGKSVDLYVGMSLSSPAGGFSDFSTIGSKGNLIGISQSSPIFLSWLNYNVSGWKSIGADGVAFKNVNQLNYFSPRTNPSIQTYLHSNMGMKCIGVGAPHDASIDRKRLGDLAYSNSPYILRSIDGGEGLSALSGSWDPDRTEIHITLPPQDINEFIITSYFDRGIIVGIEFDPENYYQYLSASKVISETYNQLESKRILKSSRNMTVFSMAAGDSRDSYGQVDNRFYSFNSSKASLKPELLPIVRVNCSSSVFPDDPDRFFIPSWWWSNSKSQCPDPSMSNSVSLSWMEKPFDKNMILSNYESPYGTTGPEKCADACFDMLLQHVSKYGAISDRPFSSSYDVVVSLENWGGSKFCSDNPSNGLSEGECRLFGHIDDALKASSAGAILYDLASPYIENGINECQKWLDSFAYRLVARRDSYAKFSVGNVPPLPSKFIFNNISIPNGDHLMMERKTKEEGAYEIKSSIKRNVDTFYGNIDAIFKDYRYDSFVFNGETVNSFYLSCKQSGEFDVDASLPDAPGMIGSYSLEDVRFDKDSISYQPNTPARRWSSILFKKILSYGIDMAFKNSISNHIFGCRWMIPGITVNNSQSETCYKIGSKISSDIMSYKKTDLSFGGLSSPCEDRMHLCRLAMPGLHSQNIPKESNINCFDISGSSIIKDGTFMPVWGASYTRPIVGLSGRVGDNTPVVNFIFNEDRSNWYDVPGSDFAKRKSSSKVDIKSSTPLKYNPASNAVSEVASSMSSANSEANINIFSYLIKDNSASSYFIPVLLGPALSDASWTERFDIGNMRTGSLTGSNNISKYKIDKEHCINIFKLLSSYDCNSAIHYPCSHVVGDWNALYESIVSFSDESNDITASSSAFESGLISNNEYVKSIDSNSSYAVSIAYDYSFAAAVLQTTSRPKVAIDKNLFSKNIFSMSLVSANSGNKYNLPSIDIGSLRAIDLVNIINRQNGIVAKILNGNSNVFVKDLSIDSDGNDRSGWIFLTINSNSKNKKISSEARSRPLDYLGIKNTSISPEITQSDSSMSFGGFITESDSYKKLVVKSPVYVSSSIINVESSNELGKTFIGSINGEILQLSDIGDGRLSISKRGMYGTRRKMHLIGDQLVISSKEIFNNNFGSDEEAYTQYRCFGLKNIDSKANIHNISFHGEFKSYSSYIGIGIEMPSIQSGNFDVMSSTKNSLEISNLELDEKKSKSLIGTIVGIPLPGGNYSNRIISDIYNNNIFVSKPFAYTPSVGSQVMLHGSRSGYSPGGLYYPSVIGNSISEFNRLDYGSKISLESILGSGNVILAPGQFVYMWIKRSISQGVKSVDAGNFMPKIEFEVS